MRHVCDFLGCPADAPYDEWVEKFNDQRKDVRNAREGTADEEEKLLQLLGPFFKPNKARWRGLLNKMAHLDLEGTSNPLPAVPRSPSRLPVVRSMTPHS